MSEKSDGRISTHDYGLGVPDELLVEERARELAAMDGRNYPNEGDISRARAELLGQENYYDSPEAPGDMEKITEWDTPPTASGRKVPEREPSDEQQAVNDLVQEGLQEAEHDERIAAADEMQENEEI